MPTPHMLLPAFIVTGFHALTGIEPHYPRSSKPVPGSPNDAAAHALYKRPAFSSSLGLEPHYPGSGKPKPGSPEDKGAKPLFSWMEFSRNATREAPVSAGKAALSVPPQGGAQSPQAVRLTLTSMTPSPLAAHPTPYDLLLTRPDSSLVDQLLFGTGTKASWF